MDYGKNLEKRRFRPSFPRGCDSLEDYPMAPDDPIPEGKILERENDRQALERFTRRLIGLARNHLDARLLYKIDPEDIVQSAYKSFFLRYGDEARAADGWDGLWGLLTRITLRKCADR